MMSEGIGISMRVRAFFIGKGRKLQQEARGQWTYLRGVQSLVPLFPHRVKADLTFASPHLKFSSRLLPTCVAHVSAVRHECRLV